MKAHRFPQRLLWLLILNTACQAEAATVNWVGGSGDWSDTSHWSTGVLPSSDDDVVIDVPGVITITHSSGSHGVQSLVCEEAFVVSGGNLTVYKTVQVNNVFTLSSGTLAEATVVAGSSGQPIVAAGGTLSGVTLAADVSISNGSSLTIANGLTFSDGAKIVLNSLQFTTALYVSPGTQEIGGTGEIVLGTSGTADRIILGNGPPTTLTLGPGVTVRGRGDIIQFTGSALINQGTIQANVSGGTLNVAVNSFSNNGALRAIGGGILSINSGSWVNEGTLYVNDATLNLGGSSTGLSATTGFSRNGGTVNVTGTLSGGLALDGVTGSWNLSGTISGGTVNATGGEAVASHA